MNFTKSEIIDTDLKVCPFCGEESVLLRVNDQYVARCTNQECVACELNAWSFTADDAAEAWNRRAG